MQKIESLEVNPYIYGQLILARLPRQYNGGRVFFFQQMVLGPLGIHMQRNKFGPLPHTIYRN